MSRIPTAILISGSGSNMAALLTAMRDPEFPARPALVISNRADAGGLDIAGAEGVPTAVIDHRSRSREDFEADITAALTAAGAELICLAGFMRVLTPGFFTCWQGKVLNIHPSLLPSFRGLHTHRRALDAGVTVHGCTVHLATPELDEGPILGQSVVPVRADDTADSLAARVLLQEHRLYPEALRRFAAADPRPIAMFAQD